MWPISFVEGQSLRRALQVKAGVLRARGGGNATDQMFWTANRTRRFRTHLSRASIMDRITVYRGGGSLDLDPMSAIAGFTLSSGSVEVDLERRPVRAIGGHAGSKVFTLSLIHI